jgi:hypothetical protein
LTNITSYNCMTKNGRNSRAGKKLLTLWLTKQEHDALASQCRRLGVDKSTFVRLATFSLMEGRR